MGNKVGRTRVYEYSFPSRLINLMSKGYLDAQIYRRLGICEKTFHNWKKDHPEFSEAYLEGKEYRKAYYFDIAKEYLEGNRPKVREGMLKKFLEVLAEEFKPVEKTQSIGTTTNINIQNMQVLNRLERPQLIQRVTDLLKKNTLDVTSEIINADSGSHSSRETLTIEHRGTEGINSDSTDS